jgi:hypothetical protein
LKIERIKIGHSIWQPEISALLTMAYPPFYEVVSIWSSELNTDIQLNSFVGEVYIGLDLLTANFSNSPKLLREYLLHVEHVDPEYVPPLSEDPEKDEFLDTAEEFYSWSMRPLFQILSQIHSLDQDGDYTLQYCLFPKKRRYTLRIRNDALTPIPLNVKEDRFFVGALLPASKRFDNVFPSYSLNEIHIIQLGKNTKALPAAF